MNKDILNIILNDLLYNDINSIKKTSLISKNMYNSVSYLTTKNDIQHKLQLLQNYGNELDKCICQAAGEGYFDIVLLMIDKGGLPSDSQWNRAMLNVIKGGHLNIVQFMIDNGAQRSINWIDSVEFNFYAGEGANNWNYIIQRAAYYGQMNIVQLMIEKSALRSAHRSIDWNKAMQSAAHGGHHYAVDIVQLIIEKGSQQSIDWNKVMQFAAYGGNIDIVQFIIEKSAQQSIDWNQVMYCAAESGHINIVQLIIEKGAQRSIDWYGAMMSAIYNDDIVIIKFMIDKGALQSSNDLEKAMSCALYFRSFNAVELLKQYQQ
jgi:ankyrin repeat protein